MIIGDMEIRLRADIARLQRDMDDARRVVGGAVNGIAEMAKMARGALIGMAAGISFAALVHQVVDAQREFDKLNASLITATGSTANAAVAFKTLQSFASTTPYSVQEATEAFIKMRNLGLDPSERALRSYGNTAAAMGKGLNQMVEAVADAATGEFERLKEFGITAKQNGDRVALTFKGMTANIGNNAKEIQEYLRKIGEVDFGGGMELRAATLDGAISNLGDTWQSVLRTIAANGIGEAMLSGVLAVSGALQDLSAILDAVGGAAGKEGQAVKEATGLHAILTTTFEALAVVGTNIAYVFQTIGKDIGAFAAQAVTLFNGGFKGLMDGSTLQQVQDIGRARVAEAEEERKAVDAKSEAILGAAAKSQAAQDAETSNLKRNTTDRLAQFQIVLTDEQKRDKALNDTLELRNRLNGVNAQTAGELTKLKNALDTGAISQAEYNRYVAQVNKDARENSTVYKNAVKQIDLQTSALQRQAMARAFDNQQAQLQIDFLKRTGQLNDEDSINKSADADLKALREQRDALEAQKKLQSGKIDNLAKVKELQGQIDQIGRDADARELKRGNDLFELDQKRYREAVGNYADLLEAAQAQSKAQQDAVRDGQDEIDMLGMTSKQIADVTAGRMRDRAALLEFNAVVQDAIDLSGQWGDESRKQAAALRAQADQVITKEEITRQKDLWGQVENTAHDTFISIFDSGKSAFDRLRDTLKNGLLELLYQMTVKQWVINIGAAVSGSGGAAGAAGSAVSSGFGSAIGNGLGITGALSSFGSFAASGFMNTVAGTGLSSGLSAAGAMISNGSVASGLGMGAGALGPYALAAIAIYSLAKGLDHSGTPHTGGAASVDQYGNASTVAAESLNFQTTAVSSATNQFTAGIATSVVSILNSTAAAFGQKAGYAASTAFADDSSSDGAWGGLRISKDGQKVLDWQDARTSRWAPKEFADGEEGQKQYLAEVSKSVRATLDDIGLPSWAEKMLDQLGDSPALEDLSKTIDTINATEKALAVMGERLTGFSSLSDDAVSALMSAAGGIDALAANAGTYYDAFYSDAEKTKVLSGQVADALAKVGLVMPATRDEYRAEVEAQIALGTSGATGAAALLGVAGAIDQLYPASQSATKSLAQIADERKGLQDKLDELTMTSSQLHEKERAAIDASNLALYDRVSALQAEKDAMTIVLGNVDNAFSVLQKVVEREKKAVQASVNVHTAAVSKLQSLSQSLRGALDSIKSPDQQVMARAAAQSQIRAVLASVKAGGQLPDVDSLKDALSAVSKDSTDRFATYQDYLKDLYQTQSDIAALGDVTDDQLSVEQKALKAAQDQLDSLDEQLAKAQEQVDILKGINTNGLTLIDAVAALTSAVLAANSNPIVSATSAINGAYQSALHRAPDAAGLEWWQNAAANGAPVSQIVDGIKGSTEATLNTLYKDVLGRAPDAEGLAFWMKAYGSTMDETEKADWLKAAQKDPGYKIPGFATGGDFAGGWRLVGENGPELEATGPARIFNASQTSSLMSRLSSPSSKNDALLASKLDKLCAAVERLEQSNSVENVAQVKQQQAMNGMLERVIYGADALQTKAVA